MRYNLIMVRVTQFSGKLISFYTCVQMKFLIHDPAFCRRDFIIERETFAH